MRMLFANSFVPLRGAKMVVIVYSNIFLWKLKLLYLNRKRPIFGASADSLILKKDVKMITANSHTSGQQILSLKKRVLKFVSFSILHEVVRIKIVVLFICPTERYLMISSLWTLTKRIFVDFSICLVVVNKKIVLSFISNRILERVGGSKHHRDVAVEMLVLLNTLKCDVQMNMVYPIHSYQCKLIPSLNHYITTL
jgi:hypothetical protein